MIPDTIKQAFAKAQEDAKVTLYGWVRTKRTSKNLAFLAVNDGSMQDNVQIVVEASNPFFEKLAPVQTGASIKINGLWKKSMGKGQQWEVLLSELEVLGETTSSYPLQKKGHTLEFLREIAHLRGRTNTFGAVFRLRNALAQGVHKFFSEQDFLWAQTPILTASDCEGAGDLFKVTSLNDEQLSKVKDKPETWEEDFFGRKSFLTVSGQLQGEIMASSHSRVYTFGPTFRAENSNTGRHLAEFWMIEPEMAFCDLDQNMTMAEEFVRYMIKYALEHCRPEIEFFEKFYKKTSVKDLEAIANADFKRLDYTDAVKLLQESKKEFQYPVEWGLDLQTEHERYLTEVIFKKPVIVYNYPKDIKAFYMRVNDDQKTVAAMDLLVPKVGELIGGSQREERFDVLDRRMDECKVHKDDLWWYMDLRRQGTMKHSGFGMGFERLVMYISGMQNIRDVIISPRAPKSINF